MATTDQTAAKISQTIGVSARSNPYKAEASALAK